MADTPPPRFASLHNPLARQMFSLEPSGQPFVDEALMEASAAWERLLDAGLIGPGTTAAATHASDSAGTAPGDAPPMPTGG